jgi:hypothetical protein
MIEKRFAAAPGIGSASGALPRRRRDRRHGGGPLRSIEHRSHRCHGGQHPGAITPSAGFAAPAARCADAARRSTG